jgi:GT2 family glycosyltransferase
MSRAVPVSLVISTFEEGRALRDTIETVLAATLTPREIIVVDDGSTDASCEGLWPSGTRVITQAHRGIARARNVGAAAATQPTLVFLDAHCIVDARWLGPLLDVLEDVPRALVGPAVRDTRHPSDVGSGAQIVDPLFTYRWCPVNGTNVVEVGMVPGGCMAMRRDVFLARGGFACFDGFGVEDVEIALRWWRAGDPLLSVPASLVSHQFAPTRSYRPDHQAWMQNVLRTALRHLRGDQLRRSIVACAQFASFSAAIATVLAEPWIEHQQSLLLAQGRDVTAYLARWAPRAFTEEPVRCAASD